ncbi:hypothetical protein HID58_013369 [Brassica napus]|uniref:Replication protein A 70 kDa DNA-binding subunit B/D first OB fold domain-containing protein n=1 Tax=Brassica napus TaxID=3708 RepID=A0ABQ8E3Q2_BRANA|nr:hypothetical protein HID58_013369 [Brassica napus]
MATYATIHTHLNHTMWKIRVKIIRLWKQYSASGGLTIEMVLIDSNGVKINTSVKKDLIVELTPIEVVSANGKETHKLTVELRNEKYKLHLVVLDNTGNSKFLLFDAIAMQILNCPCNELRLRILEILGGFQCVILNFDIRYVFELHRTTKHKYTIKFNESSLFRKIQPVNDLCGALVRVGDFIATKLAQPANIYNSIMYSLEFSLINLAYTHIQCVAYGALAHRLNAFWRSNTADVVVCVLRLWRIEWGEGGFNYVTNMEGGSDILFDSDIPEIQFFKSQIPSIDL